MPKLTPVELSRMKAEKESRDQQEMMMARRRHEELTRQQLLRAQVVRFLLSIWLHSLIVCAASTRRGSCFCPTTAAATVATTTTTAAATATATATADRQWCCSTSYPSSPTRSSNSCAICGPPGSSSQYLPATANADSNVCGGSGGAHVTTADASRSGRPSTCQRNHGRCPVAGASSCSTTSSGTGPSTSTRYTSGSPQ